MFDFPNNASDGDTVTHPNGQMYEYNSLRNTWSVVQDDLATLTARVAALETVLQNSFLLLE
jgi:hypothetical protein